MKKEKLMLDINKSIDFTTLTDFVAAGLPKFIFYKLNSDKLKDNLDLFNETKKY